jgi:hypothetical protein
MNIQDGLAFLRALCLLPFFIMNRIMRMREHVAFLRLARATEILCECGNPIAFVGLWKCSCSFTYRGHLLQICPLCGRTPKICRCYACGLTTKLPEPCNDTID